MNFCSSAPEASEWSTIGKKIPSCQKNFVGHVITRPHALVHASLVPKFQGLVFRFAKQKTNTWLWNGKKKHQASGTEEENRKIESLITHRANKFWLPCDYASVRTPARFPVKQVYKLSPRFNSVGLSTDLSSAYSILRTCFFSHTCANGHLFTGQ